MNNSSSTAVDSAAPHFDIIAETADYEGAIEALHISAFGPGRFARAAFRVREQGDYDRALSFVAVKNDELLGSVRLTWVRMSTSRSLGLLLGPLAVTNAAQNLGIGRALVAKCVECAASTQAGFVMLVGDQPYYGPLGFQIAPKTVSMPGPVDKSRLLVHPISGFDALEMQGMVRHADLA